MNVEQILKDYKPIDYDYWDYSGKGKNIIHLLTPLEKEIWMAALPFQDKRDDEGHGENVVYFNLKLLPFFPRAERIITTTASITHDLGWSQMTKTELDLFYISNWKDYERPLRDNHQKRAVEVANMLLLEVGFVSKLGEKGQACKDHVIEIISQHDTRKGFFSLEDGIVRDADKLWRYTLPHLKLSLKKRNKSVDQLREHVYGNFSKPGFFYSDISKEIGKIEFEQAEKAYRAGK
jgi:hypothetical protein